MEEERSWLGFALDVQRAISRVRGGPFEELAEGRSTFQRLRS